MAYHDTVGLGICPSCQSGNAYTNLVCDECGARLPWADAVASARSNVAAPTISSSSTIPPIPAVPTSLYPALHTWANQTQPNTSSQPHTPAIPPQDPEPITIRVSARILDWPFQCPCCGDLPDATRIVIHTHRSGQNFVRITNENWSVPHCLQCAEHLEIYNMAHKLYLYKEANGLTESINKSASHTSPTSGCTLFARWYMGCLLIGTLNGHFVTSIVNSIFVASVLTGGTKFLALSQLKTQTSLARSRTQLQVEKLIAECNQMENEAREMTKAHCCWPGLSVHYGGSIGTVHTFEFFNHVYAEAFIRLNANKIVQ